MRITIYTSIVLKLGRMHAPRVVVSGLVVATLLATVVSACGLDVVGSASTSATNSVDASVEPSKPAPDGSTPSSPDATPSDSGKCSTTSTACTSGLEAGWSPVAFATSTTAACPNDYLSADVVTNASLADGACSCTCTTSTSDPPSCAHGNMASATGMNNCAAGGTIPVADTNCTVNPFPFKVDTSLDVKLTAVPFYAGSCTAAVAKDTSKVISTAARVCTPPPACNETVCAGDVPNGFAACIAHDGDVTCPAAGPFVNKTLAGVSADLTCGGCTSCTNSATCGAATVRIYGDASCAQQFAERAADNVCGPLTFTMPAPGPGGRDVVAVKYDVTMGPVSCSATAGATSDVALAQPRTICCR